MRFHPILPIYVVVPIAVIALVLLVLFCAKKSLRKKKNIRRAVMLAIMALILARPVFLDGQSKNETNNLNFYFVVDATNSMSVEDVDKNARYVAVAKDIYDIVKAFPGSRYSVIIEDSTVYTAVPMTTSQDFIFSIWDESMSGSNSTSSHSLVAPKSVKYSKGTDVNTLLDWAKDKVQAYSKKNPSRLDIVFVMSDGENNTSSTINNQSKLRSMIDGGAVFGYGSEDGGFVISNSSDSDTHEVVYSGSDLSVTTSATNCHSGNNCVVSKINEKNLKKIASDLNLEYYHRGYSSLPSEVVDNINKKVNYSSSDESSNSFRDVYWVFSIILIILLIWDFREVLDSVMKEREYKHA